MLETPSRIALMDLALGMKVLQIAPETGRGSEIAG
jgi:hypothetical protein